ncbi:MAG: proline dehydrogenase family protein [Bacteroidetes bacterium]|nr:proline dehydrogenase family protein [Bacteroidota bacterium]HET6243007.1 proline dehydrogenase family protein [Bacteroidia bacterium]
MKISFDNTEIAFSGKSDADLTRAYILFNMVSSMQMVKIGKKLTDFSIKLNLPIKGLIKATIFKQFCGGETIAECDKTIANLADYKIKTILDYSVEGKESELEFERTTTQLIATIEKAKTSQNIPFSVFKVTGIARFNLLEKVNSNCVLTEAEKQEWEKVISRFDHICKTAFLSGIPVLIDAEESWIQDAIDELALKMMRLYNNEKAIVYNTLQMYRTGRINYLEELLMKAKAEKFFIGMKLVRGAYMEKERTRAIEMNYTSPIHVDKLGVDKDYDRALLFCIENFYEISICAGTHNEASALYLAELMDEFKIEKNNPKIYFAQLLGMSDHISYNMAKVGYNVAKYVPYGPVKEILPYLIRRAEENTSVAGQTSRELSLILKERKRRKGH